VLAFDNGEHRHIKPEDRQHPAFGDTPPPTCVLCKYRTQVLGFEAEVGAVQESHHHHVEGQGAHAPGSNVADCTFCDTFCTGVCRLETQHSHDHHHHDHDHDHDHHHHAPYPHAKHPHGPESARKSKKPA
jgi:sirohydrochlorin cobaltochelatase